MFAIRKIFLLISFVIATCFLSLITSTPCYSALHEGDGFYDVNDSGAEDHFEILRHGIGTSRVSTDTAHTVYLPYISYVPAAADSTEIPPKPEWTAQWWQWAERTNNIPINDQGAVDCSLGQSGDLWFLAGTEGGPPVSRQCTIPAGKTLAGPLLTVAWANEGDEDLNVSEKREVLDEVFSSSEPGILNTEACGLEIVVNGNLYSHTRLASPPFLRFTDPEAVSDGYWFALLPEPGRHTIQLKGALCFFGTSSPYNAVDVTYDIVVTTKNASTALDR